MQKKTIDLKQFNKLPKFIAVEGPIGAGKTTLTRLLADSFSYDTFLEQPSENPFLPDFYVNPITGSIRNTTVFSVPACETNSRTQTR